MFSVVIVARDETKPGSLLARPRGVKMTDPGNEVGLNRKRTYHCFKQLTANNGKNAFEKNSKIYIKTHEHLAQIRFCYKLWRLKRKPYSVLTVFIVFQVQRITSGVALTGLDTLEIKLPPKFYKKKYRKTQCNAMLFNTLSFKWTVTLILLNIT